MHSVLAETLCLLTSSFTCGLAMLAVARRNRRATILWLLITMALGIAFLTIELTEFRHLVADGNSWRRSGFLSGFFTLVGTHGLHITVGLTWMLAMIIKVARSGLNRAQQRRLQMLSLFWHFLDVVWIFIFTIVYLLGVVS
jgi:cytochrome o ubiquinol oxidase subunit 3